MPRRVAGVDAAYSPDRRRVLACAVVYDRQSRSVVDHATAWAMLEVPYVPGFLSFREGPAVRKALAGLRSDYGAVLFDGQGLAHPRRCGIATHLGVELGLVSVGVAKSRLVGTYDDPADAAGSWAALHDGGEVIGRVLRTRTGVKPVFVSVGHRIDLDSAEALVLSCCVGYRLPEPTRQADRLVASYKHRAETDG